MTAFLFPVTQQIKSYFDMDGKPLNGGYVYFGVANQDPRANPIQMFWDVGGTVAAAQPFRTVGGYITRNGTPANVFASGDFSSVVLNSSGSVVYSVQNSTDLQLALAVTGTGTAAAIPIVDAGSFYTAPKNVESVLQQVASAGFVTLANLAAAVANALNPTGSVVDFCGTTAPAGWVLGSGRTIGNGSSGGTERANADTSALYIQLWNASNASPTLLQIQDSTGTNTTRGASASNDFAANKRLPLPDCRDRTRAGLGNMGGTDAARLTSATLDGSVMFNTGGVETLALSTANLAAHSHTVNITDPGHNHAHTESAHNHTLTDPGHLHQQNLGGGSNIAGGGSGAVGGAASNVNANTTGITLAPSTTGVVNVGTTTGVTAASTNTGSGTAHANVQPTIIFTVIIKL